MRNIYDALLEGIDAEKKSSLSTDQYLISLQPSVKSLRFAYRTPPVYVPYHEEKIQSAYLLTYFPHYYQLIQKIFQERDFEFLVRRESINVIFVGGGPGSEAFGLIKYFNERCENLQNLTVTILDINASTWKFSHEIFKNELVGDLGLRPTINLQWQALNYDLTSIDDTNANQSLFQFADLVVFQNCINEVSNAFYPQLFKNVDRIFELLNSNAIFLMIDLTSSVRPVLQIIEDQLVNKYSPKDLVSTLSNTEPSSMLSLNAIPNDLVRKFLLNGSDGLIPRKYLKYDYSLLIKNQIIEKKPKEEFGFSGLYSPLNKENLKKFEDVKNKVFVGLDFGTSVTVVSYSYIKDGQIVLKSLELDQKDHNGYNSSSPLVPSSMALYNNHFMIGKHAFELGPNLIYGKNYWDGFKSHLGNLSSIKFADSELKEHPKVKISNGKDGLITFLKRLKAGIDEKLGIIFPNSEHHYTWSVPANYSIRQKRELRECGELAGFPMESTPFVEEPVSALLNYIYESEKTLIADEKILVLDIGAGTVDVSIMKIDKDFDNISSKLLAVERIKEIGGNKINEMIADHLREKDSTLNSDKKLESFTERLKILLCKAIITDKNISFRLPHLANSTDKREVILGSGKSILFSFEDFSTVMKNYWSGKDGVKRTIESALKKGKLSQEDISKVILTGGGSRNPYIQNFAHEMFDSCELIISDNIQEQVARGNALQSLTQHLFGKNVINPVLNQDITMCHGTSKTSLFSQGSICPTIEKEMTLSIDKFEIVYGQERLLFEIEENQPYSAVFYVDSDMEVNCEILTKNEIKILTPKIESI